MVMLRENEGRGEVKGEGEGKREREGTNDVMEREIHKQALFFQVLQDPLDDWMTSSTVFNGTNNAHPTHTHTHTHTLYSQHFHVRHFSPWIMHTHNSSTVDHET
jgi:hypothetical protein